MKKNSKHVLDIIRLSEQSNNSAVFDGRLVGVTDKTVSRIRRLTTDFGMTYDKAKALGLKSLEHLYDTRRTQKKNMMTPDWALVHKALQSHKHASLIQIHHEYKLQFKERAYCYAQFTHLYREYIGKIDISMRQRHYPGEQVFIDFAGRTLPISTEDSDIKTKAYLFVGVLGCSQYTFAWATSGQTTQDWIEGFNQMIKYFDGVPESVVPDNPKAVVTRPGKDLILNPSFRDMAEHYNITVIPARVRKPQDKSLAELGVLFVSRWIIFPLSRRKYFSVDEINRDIPELLNQLNERKFRRLPGTRKSRFLELDKPALHAAPVKPYRRLKWISEQKVDPSYHIYIDGHSYSLPFKFAHEKVGAWLGHKTIEFIHDGLRIAIHKRSFVKGGCTTNPIHRSPSHAAYASRTKSYYLNWAAKIGVYSKLAILEQFKGKPKYSTTALKACDEFKKLARSYDESRFESACERAHKEAALTVTSISSILRHKLDLYHSEEFMPVFTQNHENVRGATYFQ